MYKNQLDRYLCSICQNYAQWWKIYTLTDVVGKQRDEQKQFSPLLDLMVQTVEQQQEEREEGKEKIERLAVVEGLRKYAPNHVLLVGRPGSGKSTALVRLLLEEAERGRDAGTRGRGDTEMGREGERDFPRIPVLVELRFYQHSVLERVQAFLLKHQPNLDVDKEILKKWLRQGQLLLLLDGFNELPSQEARQQVRVFRQDYPNTPMVFTTRDLGVGGDLNITKKLEMQPLTEAQMRQFVCAYLPQQGEQMLKQLGSRLREFGETPLLLWMLCSVFANNSNQIPSNLGSVFRRFTEIYDNKLKQDILIDEEFRLWQRQLLQQLAWVMTQGEGKTQLYVALPKQKAEAALTEFLLREAALSKNEALLWLKKLLDYHLIQLGTGNQIGFCHQFLQEYYTAEQLLERLPSLSDQQLKWDYLNYLKWTEPLALMLELLEDQKQAVRVVKLALEVDWQLGARLAGEVKGKFQEETVGLVVGLPLPRLLKVKLAEITKSDAAIPALIKALEDSNFDIRYSAVIVLEKIGSDAAIPALIKALEDSNFDIRYSVAGALRRIDSDVAVSVLIQALENSYSDVRRIAASALGQIGSDAAIPALIKTLEQSDYRMRRIAASALGQIGSDAAIPALITALENSNSNIRWRAASALGQIGSDAAIPALIKALEDPNSDIRWRATEALAKIGSDAAVTALIKSDFEVRISAVNALAKIGSDVAIAALTKFLEDSNYEVRISAVNALAKIGSDVAIAALTKFLEDSNYEVRISAVNALAKIGSDAAIAALTKVLKDSNFYVRKIAAEALGKIGSDVAVTVLIKTLKHSDSDVRSRAAEALGKIGSDAVVPALIKALEHSDSNVREIAAEALGKIGSDAVVPALIKALEDPKSRVFRIALNYLAKIIGSDAVVPALIKALEHSDSRVLRIAVNDLGKIGSDVAVTVLIKTLKHSDSDVRSRAAEALGKIGSDAAITALINALEDSDFFVRRRAAEALGKIGSDAAVTALINALEDSDFFVRSSVAGALGKIGSDAAVPDLINALGDYNSDVHRSAIDALGKIGSDTAIPELIKKLQDHNSAIANSEASFNQALTALKTIQERCQYYKPPPKLTMPNSLSHNYALLIGVGESANYPQWSLPVTVKDTLALKSLLTDPKLCGYIDNEQHLRLLNDAIATSQSILSSLDWLQQQAAADSEATVLVYYSGHGWLDDTTGKYYLIPHDVEPFDIPNSALPADTFTEALRQIPAQRLLVIIDSCHAAGMATAKNGLVETLHATSLRLPGGFLPTALPKNLIDELKQGTGRAVFTSSTGKQESWIRPDGNMSIYTFHFLEALQGAGNQPGDQVVTVSDVMKYVGKTVPDSAKQLCQAEQTPFFDFATEDFPVALLHGGKGMPQQGWDEVKAEAQERINNISVEATDSSLAFGEGSTNISINKPTGPINIRDIS